MKLLLGLGLALIGCLAATAHAQSSPPALSPAPPPVEAFGRLPAIADAAISSDGSKVALAMNVEGLSSIAVYDLARQTATFSARIPEDNQLRGVGWADDAHISFLVSRTFAPGQVLPYGIVYRGLPRRVEFTRYGIANLATREMALLSTSEETWNDQGAALIAPIEGDPGFARLVGYAPSVRANHPSVFRVSLAGGRARQIQPRGANDDTIGYSFDESGQVITRSDVNVTSNRWRIFVYDGETPRLLVEGASSTGAPPMLAGLLADGRLAELDDDAKGEFEVLYAIDRSNGQRTLLAQQTFDISDVVLDPWTRRVVGYAWVEDEPKQHFFEPALQSVYERVTAIFRGSGELLSWSRDREHALVYAELGLDGGAYYVFTAATGRADRISYLYPEAAHAWHGERRAISYRARDGVRIPAYLTLPQGEARGLPLVVLVHGGPAARDTLGFDYWAAFLASRGYGVLQPNFRGSRGYGATWELAGHGQWGGLMQSDVEDGVAALARAGTIDGARVCIVGASYGGYAALAGATLTPERYKCAASIAGPSDLPEMLRREAVESGASSLASDYWRSAIGDRQEDRARLVSVSPANLAAQVRIPILIMHGADDTVVPIVQSRRMRDRLLAAHKDVRYVELAGDDHWLSDAATRIQVLRELESFLERNIGAHTVQ